jgi:AcrR family transcriptional regulator
MHQNDRGASLVEPPPPQHEGTELPPGGRQPLSCDRIVAAALRYVDDNCLDDLSMRRLGGELGVEAMSLYRYFPSKAALLDAVVSRALCSLALPARDVGSNWEPEVRAYARSFRAVARAHPHLIPLMATMGPGNPTLASIHARMIRLWSDAGLDTDTAPKAQCALQGYLTGISLWDAPAGDDRGRDAHVAGTAPADGSQELAIPADCGHADKDFEFGLDVLMGGLRERVAGTARTA